MVEPMLISKQNRYMRTAWACSFIQQHRIRGCSKGKRTHKRHSNTDYLPYWDGKTCSFQGSVVVSRMVRLEKRSHRIIIIGGALHEVSIYDRH